MPFPDTGPPADNFPTIQELHAEMRDRREFRLGAALGRIDAGMDEIVYEVGRLPTHAADASDDDLEHAERVADRLEIALHGIRAGAGS